jgi:hypothetical protein
MRISVLHAVQTIRRVDEIKVTSELGLSCFWRYVLDAPMPSAKVSSEDRAID